MMIDMLSDLQDMAAATSWMASGICGQTDPEEFFPDQGESCEAAKRVCQGCPVEARCLAYALENEIPYGVWGGATAAERHEPGAASSTTSTHSQIGEHAMFDNDPAYQDLRQTREEEGYDGPLNYGRDAGTYSKSDPLSPQALAADDLRRRGAGT